MAQVIDIRSRRPLASPAIDRASDAAWLQGLAESLQDPDDSAEDQNASAEAARRLRYIASYVANDLASSA